MFQSLINVTIIFYVSIHNQCYYLELCFNQTSMLLSKTMFQSDCVLLSTNMTQSKSMLPSVIHVSIHNLMSLSSIMFQSKSMFHSYCALLSINMIQS